MDQQELEEIAADLEPSKKELLGTLLNAKIWALVSAIALFWLLPFGVGAFILGGILFWFGTRWFKYHTLSRINEFEVYRSSIAKDELEKLRDEDS